MKLPSTTRFVDNSIKEAFYKLETGDESEKKLFKLIDKAISGIEENAFSGIQIPKKLIPKEYKKKYGVTNLWKYNLPEGWRLIYSIAKEEIIVVSLVIEWFDHKNYEKRFNY